MKSSVLSDSAPRSARNASACPSTCTGSGRSGPAPWSSTRSTATRTRRRIRRRPGRRGRPWPSIGPGEDQKPFIPNGAAVTHAEHGDVRPGGITPEDLPHLRRCIELAAEAADAGDHPFGSVLVAGDGRVLAEERNREVSTGDPT